VTPTAVVLAAFLGMEGVTYAAHRWLMHGPGMAWHRSHHAPPAGRFERNDLFPLCFAVLGVVAFAAAAISPALVALRWIGLGMTLYGVAYLFVHEIVIHGRLPVALPAWSYLRWLRESHRIHHLFGGEPYGMLLPVVPRPLRARAARSDREALDRRARVTRIRL
jgi:beta-carotene 3-hydroxylase